jgi:hypothetical protein
MLAIVVGGLLYYTWSIGAAKTSTLLTGSAIIGVGLLYAIRGSLPNVVYRVLISRDDDPSNLSPRVYLPILLGAIVIAGVLMWVYGR